MHRLLIRINSTHKRIRQQIIVGLILCGYLLIWLLPSSAHVPLCLFKGVTGIPCPGCGGIRTTKALMNFDFSEAVKMNPLSVAANVVIILFAIFTVIDIVRDTDKAWEFLKRPFGKSVIIMLVVVIAAEWAWNIYRMI